MAAALCWDSRDDPLLSAVGPRKFRPIPVSVSSDLVLVDEACLLCADPRLLRSCKIDALICTNVESILCLMLIEDPDLLSTPKSIVGDIRFSPLILALGPGTSPKPSGLPLTEGLAVLVLRLTPSRLRIPPASSKVP